MIRIEPAVITPEENKKLTDKDNGAQAVLNMESLIKRSITSVENQKEVLKTLKGQLKDALSNDPTYKEHSEAVKEATRVRNATKTQLLKKPDLADLTEKIKSISAQSKEVQLSLFDYASEYHRMTGVNEIESESGEVFEIRMKATLVKKSEFLR